MSDFEIHTGLAASAQPVVENDACRLTALAAAGAVAEEEPFAELDGVRVVLARKRQSVEVFVDGVAAREHFAVRFARIDDGFELGVGEERFVDEAARQERPVGGNRRFHRRHGRRLHELRRMRARIRDVDRLHLIGLIKRSLKRVSSATKARGT